MNLPDVTLFAIHGGVATALLKRALVDTLEQINPERVVIFTTQPEIWPYETVSIAHCPSNNEAARVQWYTVPQHIRTSHMFHVEWDGWVVDGGAWLDDFMHYDYIGAPWPGPTVGNGMGLRSVDLMRTLALDPITFPFGDAEDDLICRHYRPALESRGFKFAPPELAARFGWERDERPERHFCFHGAFNWPHLLPRHKVQERLRLADPYVRQHRSMSELRSMGFDV